MKIIGLMSGSSLDAIDVVYVEFKNREWELICMNAYDMPKELATKLSEIIHFSVFELANIESEYTHFLAEKLNDFISINNITSNDGVSVHGHTVLHLPKIKTSWQLLNGGLLSELINSTVITDFRNQDMALGGEGTPMAVIADRDLFPGYDAYLNLGGIANISLKAAVWHAYDVCPCNQILNYFAQKSGFKYDMNGDLAAVGEVDPMVLKQLLSHPFYKKQIPKSIDNTAIKTNWIPQIEEFGLRPNDVLATVCEMIAVSIHSIGFKEDSKILISGGGSYNNYLISCIKRLSPNCVFVLPEAQIIDFKESILMAYMGYLRLCGKPNFMHETTKAKRSVISGAVYKSIDNKST